ncbi:MAG: carbamoyl phosphate synthase [Gammaproteobacteria bacterium]|nr:carbamoyl phosphate synthase [Gammaproteobacteria bacterium]
MLSKILIANRGEIAVRVIRTCREMGIDTVAIYSDLDHDALHVKLADEAYRVGGVSPNESYLNTDAIYKIIQKAEVDGVHPGYGFLSENAEFARSIEKMGVSFIGPSAEAIEIMADKISAREAAEKVGVSGVPGSTDLVTESDQVVDFASEFGWPVAIKAVYGGGGRGMKVVNNAEEVSESLDSARRESMTSFGRDELYLERYLVNPRHVEIQVLADKSGNTIYLGDRDCSAQRRHQKLIEEAPAPGLTDEVRAAMGSAAVDVAKGCNYSNAGTVEFLYEDGSFYYLEMNTRLQVEHPVTEMVTGIDLVEQQILVASGEQLSLSQEDVKIEGHSIEFRINAEDPTGGMFLPSPGVITSMNIPDGLGVRFDGGYQPGDEVSQFYDNLIGKLVVWSNDRTSTIAKGFRALSEMNISGVATTISSAMAIINHDDFKNSDHSTKWVEETLDLSDLKLDEDSSGSISSDVILKRHDTIAEVDGRRFEVAFWTPDSTAKKSPRKSITGKSSSGSGNNEVSAPMQGTIVRLLVEVGDSVDVGDPVCVLEAMKMENHVTAEKQGEVKELKVAAGDSVGIGDVLAIIE